MVLRVGLFYPNAPSIHVMSSEVARANLDVTDMATHLEVSGAAEEIGLDYLFVADGWGGYGQKSSDAGDQATGISVNMTAPIMCAALASVTSQIGLISTIHTSWYHPLLLARIGTAINNLSGGRWGVNIVSGSGFTDHLLGGPVSQLGHEERYERAAESVEIASQAWARGHVEFSGTHFELSGPLAGPTTSPRPLIVSAGASEAGRNFAGRYADYIFMPGRTPLDQCAGSLKDIRATAQEAGRPAESVRLQMHASVIVGETRAEADDRIAWVRDRVDLGATHRYLKSVRKNVSTYDEIYSSMDELEVRSIGMVSGARTCHGTASEVADQFEILHDEFGAGGVAVTLPVWNGEEIRRFGRLVLPELTRRGLWEHHRSRGGWSW